MEFINTDFLQDGEIKLVLTKTADGDASRDWLPAYYFDIADMSGEKMGWCDLRIGHNKNVYYGGNIGYTVLPQFRGHAYAKKAVELLKKLAAAHGMEYLYITCFPENTPSKRTCENAGGAFVENAVLPEDNDIRIKDGQERVLVYRFDLI